MNYNHHLHQQHNNVDIDDDENTSSGLILQDVCTSLTQNLQMQSINSFQHLSSQYIEQIVEIEMKRLKANCNQEEQNYVEQMLLENPIIVERRNTPPTTMLTVSNDVTNNKNHNPNVQNITADDEDEEDSLLYLQQQQQRSESCRRSRLNNKIKKAKAKYRHNFMSNKLLHSANVLECLQKLIEQTENQLINQGFNAFQLLELRKVFYNNIGISQ